MYDLIVLGAGPAGLGAAYQAAARGLKVLVLERDCGVGGLAGSFEVDGVIVDHGSHRLHPSTSPAILAELRTLMNGDLQTRERHGRIHLEGRWVAFPLRPADLLTHLPPGFALSAARDAALSGFRRAEEDSFGAQLMAGLGPTMCHRFYYPYARKLWGLEPGEISGDQARRRVSKSTPSSLLAKVVKRGSGGFFYYPKGGFGRLWDGLAAAAVERGVEIRCDSGVEAVERAGGGFVVNTGCRAEDTRLLWSTVPLPLFARLFRPAPHEEVLQAAGQLRSRAMVLVYLSLPVDRYTEFDAHYIPGPQTPVTRISEPKNYREGDDPHGRTVLCAEIPCSAGGYLWCRSDEELGTLAAGSLRTLGLPKAQPSSVVVKRVPAAYPIYDMGYAPRLARLEEWAGSIPGLLTFGRQGLFAHNNSHHALEMGWSAAAALDREGRVDRQSWGRARMRFALQVVED